MISYTSMDYDIIATLGPSSACKPLWQEMAAAGVTGFRLNTSHLSLPELHAWVEQLSDFLPSQVPGAPLVLDLQGSKWRLGSFSPFELRQEQMVELIYADATDRPGVLPVPHMDLFQAAGLSSADLVLNDARIHLRLEKISSEALVARVVQGGLIAPRKGITFTASAYRQENMNDRDRSVLDVTRSLGFVRYAVSYVKDSLEMERYRSLFGPSVYLIAKLERQSALDEALKIAAIADELWLCRGDLGAELGIKAMAEQVYCFSETVPACPKPVLMAGQVLEHMTTQVVPTRSEICFLHDALIRGYHGFVLSDETAIGQHPLESCHAAALFK